MLPTFLLPCDGSQSHTHRTPKSSSGHWTKHSFLKTKNYDGNFIHATDILTGFLFVTAFWQGQNISPAVPAPAVRCLSFTSHRRPLSLIGARRLLSSHLHIIYTPSFENGSFLKIHLDYQTLKVTSPELSVWLGGWLQTAEQCSQLDINAWLGCAGRREEPALCSLLQPIIFYVCLFSQQPERI